MDPLLISVAAFFGVAALIGAGVFVMRDFGTSTAEDRLEILTGRKSADSDSHAITKEDYFQEGVGGLQAIVTKINRRFKNMGRLFEQADSPIKPDAFLALTVGFTALGVAGAWASHSPLPLYPVAGLMGGVLPLVWLLHRRKKRLKAFANQLPDALELIGRALRSGHSLASGLCVVHEEMPEPICIEFGIVYEEQNLGIPIEEALKNTLNRIPNMDLKFFVTAVIIQRQSGGDLAEILDKISYIIRERFKIMGQVQALTGEGRISGVILMALPIVLFLTVYQLNTEYVMLLFTDELGRKMIAVAAFLQVLGAITIKKIIKIKI